VCGQKLRRNDAAAAFNNSIFVTFSLDFYPNFKRKPRLIAVSGTAAHRKPDDGVGLIGKNSIFRGAQEFFNVFQ
jgi:hypothetical protein